MGANEQLSGDEDEQTRADFDTMLCAGYGAVMNADTARMMPQLGVKMTLARFKATLQRQAKACI